MIRLVTGICERDGRILLVASRYPNHREPLWNLPGGRPRLGESLAEALAREFTEEVGLEIALECLAYVSESFDSADLRRVVNVTFVVRASGEIRVAETDAHVVDARWVSPNDLPLYLSARVVREPLLAFLDGDERRYFDLGEAGITIEFADEP